MDTLCCAQDFICIIGKESERERILSTSSLLPCSIHGWISIQSAEQEQTLCYDRIAERLQLTWKTLNRTPPGFESALKFSIPATAEVIEYAAIKAYDMIHIGKNKCPSARTTFFDSTQKWARMREAGWCPSEISRIVETAPSLQTLHFLSRLSQSKPGDGHLCCTIKACLASRIAFSNYGTQHIVESCAYVVFSANVQTIIRILQHGSLPLLRISRTGHGNEALSFELVESTAHRSCVAISHVLTDDLGNAKANAVPQCQLSQI